MAKERGKPAQTRIREEDWNRYVDALRRDAERKRREDEPRKQNEEKGARP